MELILIILVAALIIGIQIGVTKLKGQTSLFVAITSGLGLLALLIISGAALPIILLISVVAYYGILKRYNSAKTEASNPQN